MSGVAGGRRMPRGIAKTQRVFYLSEDEVELLMLALDAEMISIDTAYREEKDVLKEHPDYDLLDPNYWKSKLVIAQRIKRKLEKGGKTQ